MMTAIFIVLAVIGWVSIGTAGYIYWWTSQFDLETDDVFFAVFVGGCFGPFAWFVGYWVHRPPSAYRVVMRQRKRGDA